MRGRVSLRVFPLHPPALGNRAEGASGQVAVGLVLWLGSWPATLVWTQPLGTSHLCGLEFSGHSVEVCVCPDTDALVVACFICRSVIHWPINDSRHPVKPVSLLHSRIC